jgi:hypothetical protein
MGRAKEHPRREALRCAGANPINSARNDGAHRVRPKGHAFAGLMPHLQN